MKHRAPAAMLFASLLALSGCGPGLSARNARSQIAALGDSSLVPDDVAIDRIVTQAGNRMIAETTLRMAFQFERDSDGEWRIVAARLGDRQWVDIATLLEALETQRIDSTTAAMEQLVLGVDAFRAQNAGTLPKIEADGYLSDVLHPLFMPELIRNDGWGAAIRYESENGSYRLRSPGPDGVVGSPDDIVVAPNLNR